MKKKQTKLILGAASLCLLGGAYGVLRYVNQQAKQAEADNEYDTILEVDGQSVSSLSFQAGGETLTFVRDGEEWQLEGDDSFPVNSTALADLLTYFSPLQAVRTLENVEDTSGFGLSDPQNVFSITDRDGTATTVTIGATNESTGDDYLMLNGDEHTIYTVSDDLRAAVSEDLYDYAQSEELPSLLSGDVIRLSLSDSEGDLLYSLVLDEQENFWSVTDESGTETEGDEEAIEDVISSFTSSFYYMSFLEHNCSDWAAYGLDEPQILTVSYRSSQSSGFYEAETQSQEETGEAGTEKSQDEDLLTLTLSIGDTDENGNYYVRQGDSTQVHTISSYALEELLDAQTQEWAVAEEETEAVTEQPEETEEVEAGS